MDNQTNHHEPFTQSDEEFDDFMKELRIHYPKDKEEPQPETITETDPKHEFKPNMAQRYKTEISVTPEPAPDDSAFFNNIEFDTKFRGYNRDQVDDYINKLTVDYNAICERCDALEQENEGLRRALAELGRAPKGSGVTV